MAKSIALIQTQTLTSTAASVTFSNIPQNYTDLKLVMSSRNDAGTSANDGRVTFNGSASGYSSKLLYGLGSGSPASASNSGTYLYWSAVTDANGLTASTFANGEMYIPNYTSSNNKSVSFDGVTENNGSYGAQLLTAGLWSNTAAITSISITFDYGNIVSGSTFSLYGIGGNRASGGTITYDGTYTYHTFTSTGTFQALEKIKGAEVLVIAGGGGGGYNYGGGGGAGGLAYMPSFVLTAGTSYSCIVGSGGAAGAASSSGTSGNNSLFSVVTTFGGGGGAGSSGAGGGTVAGTAGGSGGGGNGNNGGTGGVGGSATQTSGTGYTGYGNAGGGSYGGTGGAAGGGGGAGAVGTSGTASLGGAGGIGLSTWSSWGYATSTGQSSGGLYYYAGGGGGNANGTNASGGLGGGGAAGNPATAGTANTGGGGGGSGTAPGAGGSGIIIVRYPTD